MYVCMYVWNLSGHGSELRWHDEDVRTHTFHFPVLGVAQIILSTNNTTMHGIYVCICMYVLREY